MGAYEIYVIDAGNHHLFGNGSVNIANPYITITSPTSSDTWTTGSKYRITWTSAGTSGYVTVQLYSGTTLITTIASNTIDNGSIAWTIPSNVTAGTYTIYIVDASNVNLHGTSAAFAIAQPNTGGGSGGKQTTPSYDVALITLASLLGALGVVAIPLKKHQFRM